MTQDQEQRRNPVDPEPHQQELTQMGFNEEGSTMADLEASHQDHFSKHPQGTKALKIACLVIIILVNIAVIIFSSWAISSKNEGGRYKEATKVREVVAPLCVRCEEDWVGGEEKEDEGEEGGWRRYREANHEMCCPLNHSNLASAVEQIYRVVLDEKEQDLRNHPPKPYSHYEDFYGKPQNTEETVLFANHNKPSGHVTGVDAFDIKKCRQKGANTTLDNSMHTVCDWPLRFEPYRSSTRGYVGRLTWGLVVPVNGLYRVHSTINFFFAYPQNTRDTIETSKQPIAVVHQLTRYNVNNRTQTVLAERNQTISSGHTDGLTSFVTTLEKFSVGDVVSVSVSYRSALAMRDRWHSEGLFLVQ